MKRGKKNACLCACFASLPNDRITKHVDWIYFFFFQIEICISSSTFSHFSKNQNEVVGKENTFQDVDECSLSLIGAQSPNQSSGTTRVSKTFSGQTIIARTSSSDRPATYCIRPTVRIPLDYILSHSFLSHTF